MSKRTVNYKLSWLCGLGICMALFLLASAFSPFNIVKASSITTDTSAGFSGGSFSNVVDSGSGSSPILQLAAQDQDHFVSSGTYTSPVMDLGGRIDALGSLNWTASGMQRPDPEAPADPTGLIAQWNFDESSGSTANSGGSCGSDCNGYLYNFANLSGQDLVTQSGWTAANKKWGAGALMFNGSGNYFKASANQLFSSQFSVSFWFSNQDLTAEDDWFINYTNSMAYYGWSFHFGNGLITYVANTYNGRTNYSVPAQTLITDSNWHYITATDDGTTADLYIDGKLDATGPSYGIASAPGQMYLDLSAGRPQLPQAFGWSRINLDNMSIYSRIQSPAEVLANYQAGSIGFQTRTSADGNNWEAWAPAANYLTDPAAVNNITSPAQRYFQYRAHLATTDTTVSPLLYAVSIGYSEKTGIVDTMTRQQTGVGSDHQIDFSSSYDITHPGDMISVITYPAWDLNALDISDLELLRNGTSLDLGAVAGTDTWGVLIDNTDRYISFVAPTNSGSAQYIAHNSAIEIRIKNSKLINPALAGINTFKVTILTSDGGSGTNYEEGVISFPIVDSDQVNVTGFINTFINFDIDTGIAADVECTYNGCLKYDGGPAAGNYTVDLGELNSTWVNRSQEVQQHADGTGAINSIYLDLITNAYNGAVVSVTSANGALEGPAGNVIVSVVDHHAITANSGAYGFTLPVIGTGNGTVNRNTNCQSTSFYCALSTGATTVFDTAGKPLDYGRLRMDLAAAASYVNNPGVYTDTLTFIATATF